MLSEECVLLGLMNWAARALLIRWSAPVNSHPPQMTLPDDFYVQIFCRVIMKRFQCNTFFQGTYIRGTARVISVSRSRSPFPVTVFMCNLMRCILPQYVHHCGDVRFLVLFFCDLFLYFFGLVFSSIIIKQQSSRILKRFQEHPFSLMNWRYRFPS